MDQIHKHRTASFAEMQIHKSHPKSFSEVETLEKSMQEIATEFQEVCTMTGRKLSFINETPNIRSKDRYGDVRPYKSTAVELKKIEGVEASDYINANTVGIGKQSYICCQAPLPNTICDFWRMVWEHECSLIVMLTNFIERNMVKADSYWPEKEGETTKYGFINVKLVKNRDKNRPIVRTFCLTVEGFDGPPLTVHHLHYVDWPDQSVPDTQSIQLLLNALELRRREDKPIVVHCSAGIGRTGTFVAIHILLQEHLSGNPIDIKETVLQLRSQRMGMVQNQNQYEFIYVSLDKMIRDFKEKKFRKRSMTEWDTKLVQK